MHVQDSDDVAFISLDGNFRLCCRKNAGQQSILYEKPLSGDRVFVNQSDVDRYVQSSSLLVTLERDSESNKVCYKIFLMIIVMTKFAAASMS